MWLNYVHELFVSSIKPAVSKHVWCVGRYELFIFCSATNSTQKCVQFFQGLIRLVILLLPAIITYSASEQVIIAASAYSAAWRQQRTAIPLTLPSLPQGKVFKCLSRETGGMVAIKRYHDLEEENMVMKKMAYREIRTLKVSRSSSASQHGKPQQGLFQR